MDYVFFVIINILAFAIAVYISDITLIGREPWRRFLASIALFPIVILVCILILNLIGRITVTSVVILLALFFVVLTAARQKVFQKLENQQIDGTPLRVFPKIFWPIAALVSVLAGLLIGKFVLNGTQFGPDGLGYHSIFTAGCILDKSFSRLSMGYHAYFPFNAEVISLWFMLAFHNDALVSLVGYYWLMLVLAVVVLLGLNRGFSKSTSLLAAVIFVSSPVIQKSVKSFSAVDLAAPGMLLVAIIFAMPSVQIRSHRSRIIDAAYCGLAIGFAIGSKVSLAPAFLVLFLWIALSERKALSIAKNIQIVSAFVLCAMVTGGVWYIRNIWLTGNPLFPAEIGPFDGPFLRIQQYRTKLISWIFERPFDVSQWNYIFRSFIDWPVSIFFLSAAGYISGIYYVIRNRFSAASERPRGDVLLLIIGITLCLFYPFMPFSGTSCSPNAELMIRLRYLILPFTIGVVLFARMMDKSSRFGLFWFWLAVCAIALRWGFRVDKLVLAVVAVMMIKIVSVFWDRYSKVCLFVPVRKIAIFVLLPGLLVGLLVFFPYQKYCTDKRIFENGGKDSPRGQGWRALEQLPDGSAIAAYGTIRKYPNFGRRLQFRYVKVNEDGTKYIPLYVCWKLKPESAVFWSKKISAFPGPNLIDNLVNSGVDYVLTSKFKHGEWPVQHNGLVASGKAEKVFDDGYSVIWKLPVCNKF